MLFTGVHSPCYCLISGTQASHNEKSVSQSRLCILLPLCMWDDKQC
jgi:hypothetical protein